MANILNLLDTYDQTYGKREDLSSAARVAAYREFDAPVFALLPRVPATARNISWTEDAARTLTGVTIATGAACAAAATSVICTNYDRVMPYDIIAIDSEWILVTGVSSSTLTIVRGFAGTTDASHASLQSVSVVGRANIEGANESAIATLKTIGTNQCQIIQNPVRVSATMRAINSTEGDEWIYQIAKQLGEWNRMVEYALIHGKVNVPTTNATPRMMNGIVSFLSSEVTSTATSISTKNFNDFIRGIWDNGGQPDVLVVDSLFMQIIHEWNVGKLAMASVQLPGMAGTVGGVMATRWYSPFGVFTLLPSRVLGKTMNTSGTAYTGNCLAITSSEITLRPLRPVGFYLYGKAGDYDKGIIVGEYTIQVENEDHHGLRCAATNSA